MSRYWEEEHHYEVHTYDERYTPQGIECTGSIGEARSKADSFRKAGLTVRIIEVITTMIRREIKL